MAAKSASLWATHHASLPPPPARPLTRLRLSTSATAVFLGGLAFSLSLRPCSAAIPAPPLLKQHLSSQVEQDEIKPEGTEKEEDRKIDNDDDDDEDKAFEAWKSKTYALTVPLRVVALRGSVPPSWIKEFMQSQGKRLKFQLNLSGSLDGIFSDLSTALNKRKFKPSSIVAADLISVGDSWLCHAIKKAVIEPMDGVEDQDWFNGLSSKWKVFLRRNSEGDIDREGKVWAAPYRWGCMVIAYKKTKFRKQNLAPIEDWKDLWRPELAGRISMVDSPREVVGAVLKYMGASYNTNNIDAQVAGGKTAVSRNLVSLANQVRLFDSTNYLKAFGIGDVWVAVGWSSDVLPVAKRMSNVAVIVPKSGASLWADLWAIPASTGLETNRIGGRVRGPSPLLHQWVEFCLQAARAIPFKQEVLPGASPSALENVPLELLSKGKPKLDTNLVAGVPPPDILAKCEFLEPLSDSTLSEYQWLISRVEKADRGLVRKISSSIRTLWMKLNFKTA